MLPLQVSVHDLYKSGNTTCESDSDPGGGGWVCFLPGSAARPPAPAPAGRNRLVSGSRNKIMDRFRGVRRAKLGTRSKVCKRSKLGWGDVKLGNISF